MILLYGFVGANAVLLRSEGDRLVVVNNSEAEQKQGSKKSWIYYFSLFIPFSVSFYILAYLFLGPVLQPYYNNETDELSKSFFSTIVSILLSSIALLIKDCSKKHLAVFLVLINMPFVVIYFYRSPFCSSSWIKNIKDSHPICRSLCVPEKERERACHPLSYSLGGISRCKRGIQRCEKSIFPLSWTSKENTGIWSSCNPYPEPLKHEECNGRDDNCDGIPDNGVEKNAPFCEKNKGVCAFSRKRCGGEKGWLSCTKGDYEKHNRAYETKEITCDGKDNDCDGYTDNETQGESKPLVRACSSREMKGEIKGVCKKGIQTCVNGNWGSCEGEILPKEEDCNGLDDDCDGLVDNDGSVPLQKDCFPSERKGCRQDTFGKWHCMASCRLGKQICNQGRWSSCLGFRIGKTEECNGKDDDCDGFIDNAESCSHHYTLPECEDKQGRLFLSFSPEKKGKDYCQGMWIDKKLVSVKSFGTWCHENHKEHADSICPEELLNDQTLVQISPFYADMFCKSKKMRLPRTKDHVHLFSFCRKEKKCSIFSLFDLLYKEDDGFSVCESEQEPVCRKVVGKKSKIRASFFCVKDLEN